MIRDNWLHLPITQMMTVDNAREAIQIGREVMSEAGHEDHSISGAKKKGNNWIVKARVFLQEYTIEINATSGEVERFEQTD